MMIFSRVGLPELILRTQTPVLLTAVIQAFCDSL
jgi:hypothetical protein